MTTFHEGTECVSLLKMGWIIKQLKILSRKIKNIVENVIIQSAETF